MQDCYYYSTHEFDVVHMQWEMHDLRDLYFKSSAHSGTSLVQIQYVQHDCLLQEKQNHVHFGNISPIVSSSLPLYVQQKSFLSDDHRVDYVQVDEKKTQALQNTKMEWTDVRQSKP